MWAFGVLAQLLALPALVASVASTDSYRDADTPQSGHLPNHNLDPSIVGSSSFSTLWSFTSPNAKELSLAKPLVYTPAGGSELVITSSEMNNIRVFDSRTGTLVKQRQLQAPFSAADSNCGDVPDWIGVTGTPIIDPSTDVMYVFSKGYRDGATNGTANGVYKMFALKIPSLADVTGFPVLIDGTTADNDPSRYFVGGVAHQRPALTQVNGNIIAGFGSHCGRWNYTGYLVSVSTKPGRGVVSMWATEASPGAPAPQALDLPNERSGKAGIWQSGMGLAVVDSNVFFVTGNGQGHANGYVPASGRVAMSTLDECVVKMDVSADGKLSLADYFQPYDYIGLDAGDRDVGSSGLCILDRSVFNGNGVNGMAVTAGKEGRVYVVNVDELGGFRRGANNSDAIVQEFELGGSVFGGFGSYPSEGGYIYVTTVGGPLRAYKLGRNADGVPSFSLAGTSNWLSTGRVGVGQMTVTSDKGQAGTGIVWITDVTIGLQAFRAVPENGVMIQIPLNQLPGANKYQRPAFGDGRVYVQANTNKLFCMGSPVAQAISCSAPVNFGSVQLGRTSTTKLTCQAKAAIASVISCTTANSAFVCSDASVPRGAVASGATFQLDVSWNLNDSNIKTQPGFISSSLTLSFVPPSGYAASAIVSLQGTATTPTPFLVLSSTNIDFGRLITGSSSDGLAATVQLTNSGNSSLTFLGMAWAPSVSGPFSNISETGELGSGFSSTKLPAIGSILAPFASLTVDLKFFSTIPNLYSTILLIWTDGGTAMVTLAASVNNPPVITYEVSDGAGGWTPILNDLISFGNVQAGSHAEKQIRICNIGGSPLTLTISKPPSAAQILATNPSHELTEGQQIEAGACTTGTVAVRPIPVQPNHPQQVITTSWSLSSTGMDVSTGEPSGRHDIVLSATITSQQVGPLLADGTARFQYVGCFADTTQGRNLVNQVNTNAQQANNTIQQCQTLCYARGNQLAGLENHRECWCGDTVRQPATLRDETLNLCTFDCTGDGTQACGGNGGYLNMFADTTRFDLKAFYVAAAQAQAQSATATSKSSTTGIIPSSSSTTVIGSTVTSGTSSSTTTSIASDSSSTGTSSSVGTFFSSFSSTSSSTVGAPTSNSGTSTGTSSTTSSSPGAVTTGVSPINSAQPAVVAGHWSYAGCMQDLLTDNVRTLGDKISALDDMTLDKCAATCSTGTYNGQPFNFFGVEYGRECYCGWALTGGTAAELAAPEADCDNKCMGADAGALGLCGGRRRLSVFANMAPSDPPPKPVHVARAGAYQWVGCQTEATAGRALSEAGYASDLMTVDACATFCGQGGWAYMGVEYERECFCGTSLGAGSDPAPLSDCSMLCKNNQFQFCGGGSRLDLYALTFSSSSISSLSSTSSPISTILVSTSATGTTNSTSTSAFLTGSTTAVSSTSTTSSSILSSTSTNSSSTTSSTLTSTASSSTASPTFWATSSTTSTFYTSTTVSLIASSSTTTSLALTSSSLKTTTSSPITASPSATSSTSNSSSTSTPFTATPSTSTSSTPTFAMLSSIASSSDTSLQVSIITTKTTSTSISAPSSTSSLPSATTTDGYYHLGCFRDTSSGHALPALFSNNSVTPELCIDYANSVAAAAATTAAPFVFVEYHHECYGGATLNFQGSAVTTAVGTKACGDYCYGSVRTVTATDGRISVTTGTANMCGGAKWFNLYARQTGPVLPSTGGALVTATVN